MSDLSRRTRTRRLSADYWPGFVDAMAALLLVIIFVLSVFILAQFFLVDAMSGRDAALARLNGQISELSNLLALEKRANTDLQSQLAMLNQTLSASQGEQERLAGLLAANRDGAQAQSLEASLDREQRLTAEARAEVELVNQQLDALRGQLAALEQALEAAEAKDRQSRVQIANLGRRLNAALAQKIQELARYRSDFFGALRAIMDERSDVQIVGDRFVFPASVLFESGSARISPAGRRELRKLASVLLDISGEIPGDINWILRVDGHTDIQPINTPQFPSNWHLSAERAIRVVTALRDAGVPPDRLVAAGFGEYQPLDPGGSAEALRRNRRIEFKLTGR